jgi:hypothetical protein
MNPSPPQKAKAQLTPDFQKSGFPSQLISKLITISGGTIKSAACRLWRRSSRIGLVRSGKVSPLRLRSQTIQLHTQRETLIRALRVMSLPKRVQLRRCRARQSATIVDNMPMLEANGDEGANRSALLTSLVAGDDSLSDFRPICRQCHQPNQ